MPEQAEQILTELTRAGTRLPVREALDRLLDGHLPDLLTAAIDAPAGRLPDLLDHALQLAPQPGPAAQLADQLPEHSVRLAALAATLTSQQVTQYRADALGGEPDAASRLARSLNNLSRPAGRPGAAGGGAGRDRRRPSTICRELAAARPDAFRPGLAASLNNLSVRLADLGRREEALAAIQEAAQTYRELAAARPDAFRPGLAASLNNLSVQLADLGRREEALAASEEAVTICRELAAARPDAFRPGLARSLNNLSRPAGRPGAAGGGAGRDPGGRHHLPGAGRGPPGRVPARPGHVAEQPVAPAGRAWGGGRRRWPRSRRPSPSAGSWPRPARTRSGPTWPCR